MGGAVSVLNLQKVFNLIWFLKAGWMIVLSTFPFVYYFYLCERQRHRDRDTERFSIYWFTHQMMVVARTEPGWSLEPGTPSISPLWAAVIPVFKPSSTASLDACQREWWIGTVMGTRNQALWYGMWCLNCCVKCRSPGCFPLYVLNFCKLYKEKLIEISEASIENENYIYIFLFKC